MEVSVSSFALRLAAVEILDFGETVGLERRPWLKIFRYSSDYYSSVRINYKGSRCED